MAAIAICVALIHIGFSNDAAMFLTDEQDLNNLEELTLLDDQGVKMLCKICQCPGGQVPNALTAIATGGAPNIMNPRFQVSWKAKNNLKLACHLLCYKVHTSWTPQVSQITLLNVHAIKYHKEAEDSHDDVDPPEINMRDWPRMMEAIEEWL